ncbi:MAG: hypothetical protein R3Y60_05215 [bacterium]
MINLLTEASTGFSLESLWIALIIFLPILLALISSKTWNVVHGIITFLLASFLLSYVDSFESLGLLGKILTGDNLQMGKDAIEMICKPINLIIDQLVNIESLNSILTGEMSNHIILGGLVLLFVISQVVGSMFRRNR